MHVGTEVLVEEASRERGSSMRNGRVFTPDYEGSGYGKVSHARGCTISIMNTGLPPIRVYMRFVIGGASDCHENIPLATKVAIVHICILYVQRSL